MIPASSLLAGIPSGLREPLIEEYKGVVTAFAEGKWKASGIDAGRFCEVAYTILDGALTGPFAAAPSKPANFPHSCAALEARPPIAVGDRSLRILLPRVLPPIYEIRNNRNIGHVGGDVVSNKMDASYVVAACTFVMAELIRVFHKCSTIEAQESVDALVERRVPLVWDYGGGKRVLSPNMSAADKVLVLLYSETDWVSVNDLFLWTKYSNKSVFESNVLENLDDGVQIEFDRKGRRCKITPLGIQEVETRILNV
ncbi:MAG: hypothetical protein SFU86_18395 [Pirellulaceae bacterium]|nr:hypothetical protein [Pirellulaceae bacterium]